MTPADRPAFADLLSSALAFYRQDMSEFALGVWWQACQPFELQQVRKALTAHAMDPERGQFTPKPADLVRQLQGTQTDRAIVAWGRVLEAMTVVGAYTSVVFDDPAIHASLEDLGGWITACRSRVDELPFLQRRFCDAYRAYARREAFGYAAVLHGEHAVANGMKGLQAAPPVLLGDPDAARRVMAHGGAARQLITSAASTTPRLTSERTPA